ncbi:MAG: hypothetical protein L0220_35150, partial [Acidobacteria bacterium]|nr:hypothetical protein [Acidobacteriota bacterium]
LLATTSGSSGTETRFHHPDRLGTRLVTDSLGDVVSEQLNLPFGTMLPFTQTYGGENSYQHPTLSNPSKKRFTSYDRSDAVVAVMAAGAVGQYWGSILITKGVVAALFGSSALLATAGWVPGKIGQIAGAIVTGGLFLGLGKVGRTPNTFPLAEGASKGASAARSWVLAGVGAVNSLLAQKASQSKGEVKKAPPTFSDCFNMYKFTSSVGTIFGPTAESVAEFISVTSYISFAGDMIATAKKASGKTLGKPQSYASGLNWGFRRLSRGAVRGALTAIGDVATPALAITAVFTASYDLTIAAQCASGILK